MTDAERTELQRLRAMEADEFKSDTERAAESAWTAVKKADDAAWPNLPMEIRHKLIALAEKALAGRAEQEGDYAPVGFFLAVRSGGYERDGIVPFEPFVQPPVDPSDLSHLRERVAGLPEDDPRVISLRELESRPAAGVDDDDGKASATVNITDLQSANEPRTEVNDEALASQEPEFPSLHPESAAHLSNETFVPTAPKGQLPSDFPGLLTLKDEGINTYGQLRKRLESGEHIPGVGPSMLAKIQERLSE